MSRPDVTVPLDAAHAVAPRPSSRERFNAAVYDPFLALGERRGMAARRARLLGTARGRVLEIGAGTGLNLAHYPAAVHRVVLSEPDPGMAARLRRRVQRRDATSVPAATVAHAPAEALPFADGAFDTVVSTLVLCTVPDPAAAIAEVRRVLRPGGRLLLIEHVLTEGALGRGQRLLARPWAAFAAGCRCDRPTVALLAAGGFDVRALRSDAWGGMPRIVRPLVAGAATAPQISPSRVAADTAAAREG
jgi:SAM-dependent methyltransferase